MACSTASGVGVRQAYSTWKPAGLGQAFSVVFSCLVGQVLDFSQHGVLAPPEQLGNASTGRSRHRHLENPLVQVGTVLALNGLYPRSAELTTLAIEVDWRLGVVNASRVAAGWPGVPHTLNLTEPGKSIQVAIERV